MKVLCFYADHFSYTIGDKNHEAADEAALPGRFAACIVAKAPSYSMARIWADL